MSELDKIYEEAREYAEGERQIAIAEVEKLDIERLKKEYVDLISMVAYYTKIEQTMSAKPRYHFDGLRAALKDIDAEEILRQAELAEDDGIPVGQYARVKAKPLLNLLRRVTVLLPSHQ